MTAPVIFDCFAGPGGWDVAAHELGLRPIGFEHDKAACLTRAAAGHLTIRADVSKVALGHLRGRVRGLILSPPCQDFSLAGKQAGIKGYRGQLVFEVIRWTETLEPNWIACEQVPGVLSIWEDFAYSLRAMGYQTWTGVLNTADFGVPQIRLRAILMAKRERFSPPAPTHSPLGEADDLFGANLLPYVTMAEGLGWPAKNVRLQPGSWADGRGGNRRLYDPNTEPAPTVCIGHDACGWAWVRPATTIVGSFKPQIVAAPGYRVSTEDGPRQDAPGSIEVTLTEAAVLQGFPTDYPWQGPKTKRWQQVGNAIPPPLALAILRQLV